MLAQLRKVEDKFYENQAISIFLKNYSVFDLIVLLNKASKNDTRVRIKRFFYKLATSDQYLTYLYAGLTKKKDEQKQFVKYISSEHSQEYFELLQKKELEVLKIMECQPDSIGLVFSLVKKGGGIKMIKFISGLYGKYGDADFLYSPSIREQLERGLEEEDTVVQMRFIQIIGNIAVQGGRNFKFIGDLLDKSLTIYKTDDILLKLNIVEVVGCLGENPETAELLKNHEIWDDIERDAMNSDQEFYARKSLLILLVDMFHNGFYKMNPRFVKNTIAFLLECFVKQGEYLQGGLELIWHLFRTNQGIKVVVQNKDVFSLYILISRTTNDQHRNQFLKTLASLTEVSQGQKQKSMIINLQNCIGNPNLCGDFSQNMASTHINTIGLEEFSQWLCNFMNLPFEDLEQALLNYLINLMQYPQICGQLFQSQQLTKFLLRKPCSPKLNSPKNKLLNLIVHKSDEQWKDTKLQAYGRMLEKELQREKMDLQYDMGVE